MIVIDSRAPDILNASVPEVPRPDIIEYGRVTGVEFKSLRTRRYLEYQKLKRFTVLRSTRGHLEDERLKRTLACMITGIQKTEMTGTGWYCYSSAVEIMNRLPYHNIVVLLYILL